VSWSERQLAKIRITHACIARTIIWVVPVVILLLVQCWLDSGWFSILYIVVSTAVLTLCLAPNAFSQFMAKSLCRRKSEPVTVEGEVTTKSKSKAHIVDGIVNFQADVFTPVLWFLVFGAAGALAYRLWVLFIKEPRAHKGKETAVEATTTHWCAGVLTIVDGIAARVWMLLLMLAGNFAGTFGIWWESLLHFQRSASDLVKEASKAALGTEQNAHAADDLLDRSMILLLVIVAILTLTAWVS
jgi:membrane protein required for beta-lactamase induction